MRYRLRVEWVRLALAPRTSVAKTARRSFFNRAGTVTEDCSHQLPRLAGAASGKSQTSVSKMVHPSPSLPISTPRATLTRSPRHAASRITRRRIAADFFTSGVRERVSRLIAAFRSTRFLAPARRPFPGDQNPLRRQCADCLRPPTPRQRHETEILRRQRHHGVDT